MEKAVISCTLPSFGRRSLAEEDEEEGEGAEDEDEEDEDEEEDVISLKLDRAVPSKVRTDRKKCRK